MTLPIKGTSLGNPDDATDRALQLGAKKPGELRRYAVALWVRCAELGIRADAAFAQADLETGTFTSTRWTREGNPAGLGITTGMPDSTVQRTLTPEEWADIHAIHLGGYAGIDPGPTLRALDFRWQAMVDRGWFGVAKTMQDLDERWAEDGPQQYGDVIESRWRNYNFPSQERWTPPAGDGTGGNEGRPDMAGFQKVQFVGAKGPVYLPDDIEVIIDIVPSRITNVRSNQRSTAQTITTWHDTGNPNSDARGERNYLHSGAEGRAVGYNFAFDAKRIYQLTPLDEVTWHAGTANGNRTSWGAEQCLNTDWAGALRVGAALHGGLCQMMGWAVDTHLVKHQYWYGKWCPAQILNRGIWSQVVKMTSDAALAAAGAATGGSIPPTAPVYAKPVPIPELAAFAGKPEDTIPYRVDGDGWVALAVFDRVRAAKDTPRLRYSGGTEMVGGPVKAGEEFDVDWLLISADFPDTYLTPWNTRIRAADTERVSDVKVDTAA